MADTKVSALTNASALTGAEEFHVEQGAADRAASVTQVKTFVTTAPVWAAGTASANTWPKLTSGTLLTTAEVGALELDADALYATTDAGNRGVIPVRHLIRANATRTLGNVGTEQAIFNSPANGRLTLETGTYLFDSMIHVTVMSATSGNAAYDPLGAGTAVVNDWLWHAWGLDATNLTTTAQQTGSFAVTQQSPASIISAAVGTGLAYTARGTFTVTTAGTLIPSLTLVTAIATAVVSIGSYFVCERIGGTSLVSVGQWD